MTFPPRSRGVSGGPALPQVYSRGGSSQLALGPFGWPGLPARQAPSLFPVIRVVRRAVRRRSTHPLPTDTGTSRRRFLSFSSSSSMSLSRTGRRPVVLRCDDALLSEGLLDRFILRPARHLLRLRLVSREWFIGSLGLAPRLDRHPRSRVCRFRRCCGSGPAGSAPRPPALRPGSRTWF